IVTWEIPPEELGEAIDRLIEDWLENLDTPPVDALNLARNRFGLSLRTSLRTTKKPCQLRLESREILLRPDLEEETRQAAVAHALGELGREELAKRMSINLDEHKEFRGRSIPAMIARRLLVPTGWLREKGRLHRWNLQELKTHFSTATPEAIARRFLDLEDPCVITIVDNDQVSHRRSNAWPTSRELQPIEREVLDQIQRYSRPFDQSGSGWRVQGWPVHRVDWRQEILRSSREDG
ncbi:MAG: hypothetical protein ACKO23_15385, partial [Gemmataceae bacterium]